MSAFYKGPKSMFFSENVACVFVFFTALIVCSRPHPSRLWRIVGSGDVFELWSGQFSKIPSSLCSLDTTLMSVCVCVCLLFIENLWHGLSAPKYYLHSSLPSTAWAMERPACLLHITSLFPSPSEHLKLDQFLPHASFLSSSSAPWGNVHFYIINLTALPSATIPT